MLEVCRAGSKVTEVLAQYAGLNHRPSMTKSGPFHQLRIAGVIAVFGSNQNCWCAAKARKERQVILGESLKPQFAHGSPFAQNSWRK